MYAHPGEAIIHGSEFGQFIEWAYHKHWTVLLETTATADCSNM